MNAPQKVAISAIYVRENIIEDEKDGNEKGQTKSSQILVLVSSLII